MIPRFNIKRIKNRLEGNTRWMDYLPPILNFAPPRFFSQIDLVFDESDRSFLTAFGTRPSLVVDERDWAAGPVYEPIVFLSKIRPTTGIEREAGRIPPRDLRLTPLGRVLAKSVEMILPDFNWEEVPMYLDDVEVKEEYFNIEDILFNELGTTKVGDVVEFTATVGEGVGTRIETIYELTPTIRFDLTGSDSVHYYDEDLYYLGKTLPANYVSVEAIGAYDAKVNLEGDFGNTDKEIFDPYDGLTVTFKTAVSDPQSWTDDEVRIKLNDLISIRKQLFDKVKSDSIYITDLEVYNFIFSGAIDKNQLTLFGDLDG